MNTSSISHQLFADWLISVNMVKLDNNIGNLTSSFMWRRNVNWYRFCARIPFPVISQIKDSELYSP